MQENVGKYKLIFESVHERELSYQRSMHCSAVKGKKWFDPKVAGSYVIFMTSLCHNCISCIIKLSDVELSNYWRFVWFLRQTLRRWAALSASVIFQFQNLKSVSVSVSFVVRLSVSVTVSVLPVISVSVQFQFLTYIFSFSCSFSFQSFDIFSFVVITIGNMWNTAEWNTI